MFLGGIFVLIIIMVFLDGNEVASWSQDSIGRQSDEEYKEVRLVVWLAWSLLVLPRPTASNEFLCI